MLFLGPFGLAKMMLIEQPNLSAYSFQSHPLDQILGYTSKGRRSGYSIGLSSSGIYGYENLCKVTLLLICPPYSVRLKLMCFLSYNSGWLCRGRDIGYSFILKKSTNTMGCIHILHLPCPPWPTNLKCITSISNSYKEAN